MKSIEDATGICPAIMAALTVDRLDEILKDPKLSDLKNKVALAVENRSGEHWKASPKYRRKWTSRPALLRSFFQHWACAEALKMGIYIPDSVKSSFGNGL